MVGSIVIEAPAAGRPHGYARYKLDGCRCYVCGFAVSEYERNRQRAIAEGRGPVAGDVLRTHLRALAAGGMGYKRVAAVAGVATSTVGRILFGRPDLGRPPTTRVRYSIARKLLAVQAVDHGENKPIEASGTVRRLQALVTVGHTRTELAHGIGWSLSNLSTMIRRGSVPYGGLVEVRTARAVRELYDRLAMTPSTGPYAERARADAHANAWFPPLAWDDDTIDDPHAVPCLLPPVDASDPSVDELTVQHAYTGHAAALDGPTRAEVVRRLTACDTPTAEVARIAQTTVAYVGVLRSQLGVTRGRADA